jgi:gas vesicle protein
MNMVEGSLDTTNLLLGILAVVSVLEAVLLVVIGVMVWRLYAHARRTIHEIEQRQIAPLAARANALMTSVDDVLTDVKGITSRFAQQAERLDSAIRTTVDHADETAGRVRRVLVSRVNRVIAVLKGVRTACDIFFKGRNDFFKGRNDDSRTSGPSKISGAGSPQGGAMADGNDRDEKRGAGVALITGLLVGTVVGVGLGMLLAPKSGSELRSAIGEQAKSLRRKAAERSRQVSELPARGRSLVDRGRQAVSLGIEEVRHASGATTGRATSTIEEVRPRSPEL